MEACFLDSVANQLKQYSPGLAAGWGRWGVGGNLTVKADIGPGADAASRCHLTHENGN